MNTEKNMHENVAKLLPHIPMYGPFEQQYVWHNTDTTGDLSLEVLFTESETVPILQHLVSEDFATRISDTSSEKFIIQLTEKGRSVKQAGIYEDVKRAIYASGTRAALEKSKVKILSILAVLVSLSSLLQGLASVPTLITFYRQKEICAAACWLSFFVGVLLGLSVLAARQLIWLYKRQ